MDAFTAIAYCPCCVSALDIEGAGEQAITCGVCGTHMVLTVDPEKFHEHAMNG